MYLEKFSIKFSSTPICAAIYKVNVTSPAQLPLVSGCRNSGAEVVLRNSRRFEKHSQF
jgi:hypothetical protein